MLLTEKGHSFRIDSILGEKTTTARHTLPVTFIAPTPSYGRAVAVKRPLKVIQTNPENLPRLCPEIRAIGLEAPPAYVSSGFTLPYIPDSHVVSTNKHFTFLDINHEQTSRERHLSDDDDKASVASSDSGRSTPDDISAISNVSSGKGTKKKARTSFAVEQVSELEHQFQLNQYVSAIERESMSERLGLTELQIKTWFQNRRMKERRSRVKDERTAAFPTGGVDIVQLQALGLPFPPPPRVVKRRSHKENDIKQAINVTCNNQIPLNSPYLTSHASGQHLPIAHLYSAGALPYMGQYMPFHHNFSTNMFGQLHYPFSNIDHSL